MGVCVCMRARVSGCGCVRASAQLTIKFRGQSLNCTQIRETVINGLQSTNVLSDPCFKV